MAKLVEINLANSGGRRRRVRKRKKDDKQVERLFQRKKGGISQKLIVTMDLAPTLYRKGLSPSVCSSIKRLEMECARRLGHILREVCKTVPYLPKELGRTLALSTRMNTEFPVVSMDPRVFDSHIKGAGEIAAYLEIRRIADPLTGEIIGIAPREGAAPIKEQREMLVKKGLREIELVDIGTFTGRTMKDVVRELGHPNVIRVEQVYFAIAAMEKSVETREFLKSMGIKIHIALPAAHTWDWVSTTHALNFRGLVGPNGQDVSYWDFLEERISIPKEYKSEALDLFREIRSNVMYKLRENDAEDYVLKGLI